MTSEKRLVVWVEGKRDRGFFETVVIPRLVRVYDMVLVKEYRHQQPSVINRRLRALAHDGFDRLFIADLNAAPCIASRKEKLKTHYQELQDEEIIVVSMEIESWYLAGLSPNGEYALKVDCPTFTDRLTKEGLDRLRPSGLDSEPFLLELLQSFEFDTACRRNRSFAYFCRKCLP